MFSPVELQCTSIKPLPLSLYVLFHPFVCEMLARRHARANTPNVQVSIRAIQLPGSNREDYSR